MLLMTQRWKGEGALLGIRATLSEGVFMATSHNSRHAATVLRTSAKIRQNRTSYVRRMLSGIERSGIKLEKEVRI